MTEFISSIWAPFAQLLSADGALYWPHLAGFALFGAGVWAIRPDVTKGRGLLSYLFPPEIYRTASAQLDLRFFVVNTLLYTLLIVPMTLTSAGVARMALTSMVQVFGVPDAPWTSGPVTAVIASASLVVAADFGFFIAHCLQHKVPALWAFHKTHHSAEVLHPLTAFRSHPVDLVLDFACMGTMMGLVTALLAYLFDADLTPVTVFGVNVFVFAFRAAGSHLRHSHIWLDYGPRLSWILVSPAMHQLHHSTAGPHLDKNLGGMLAIWDGLFGTIYVPRAREVLSLGLAVGESRSYRTVLDLYLRPFQELFAMMRSGQQPARAPKAIEAIGSQVLAS